MWMMVLFDLPVLTDKERRDANNFRKSLLDQGFDRCQLSVYLRFCAGKEQAQVYTKRVQEALPESGNVQIIYFTDKQYENIVSFHGPKRRPANKIHNNSPCFDAVPNHFSVGWQLPFRPVTKLDRPPCIIADGRSGSNRNTLSERIRAASIIADGRSGSNRNTAYRCTVHQPIIADGRSGSNRNDTVPLWISAPIIADGRSGE